MSTMKKMSVGLSVLFLAAVPSFAQNNAPQLEANKKLAQRFFDMGMRDPSKLAEIIHPDYIQHNPMFQRYNEEHGTKGLDGMMKFIQSMMAGRGAGPGPGPGGPPPAPPGPRIYMADNDLVTVLSSRTRKDKDGKDYEAWSFDTWRVKDGKLHEHWDGNTLP